MVELAARGDLAAAKFCFDCTEAAKVRIDLNETKDITFHVEQNAHEVIAKLLRDDGSERVAVEREQAASSKSSM
jgi:hypothetical protein